MKKTVNIYWVIFCICAVCAVAAAGTIYHVQKTQTTLKDYSATPVIVIDPGHGGMDSGAVGVDGQIEKEINLAIAQKLDVQLKALGFKTMLTREEDISIHDSDAKTIRQQKTSDLKNRLKMVEDTPYSVLISIHQNIYTQRSAWGTQVFYGKNCPQSKELAEMLQKTIASFLQPDNDRVVKQGGKNLYILYQTTKPAVLVECGFLSNKNEANRLLQEEYQEQLAFAICISLLNCLAEF